MKLKISIILFFLLFLISCGTGTYIPPKIDNNIDDFSRIVNKPFDETWESLIDYIADTFYGIDNFEKDSGLLTLSFGVNNPSEYITGGLYEDVYMNNHFSGDYVDYLDQSYNTELSGRMNIVVSKVDDKHTKVTINVRYVFISSTGKLTNRWVFDSGECGSTILKGTNNKRTICPTYKAEKEILKAVENL